MDEKSANYQALIRAVAAAGKLHHDPVNFPVEVHIVARKSPPKGASKAKRAAMLAGVEPWSTKSDADNLAKAQLDAMNGVVWRDDALVARLVVEKVYADPPGVDVTVKKWTYQP